ncbi:MAG: hypothetical protein GXX84_03365 [Acidobacteria bacterium]|nr:hypothetical protein [Acidobacteriota bacterium]
MKTVVIGGHASKTGKTSVATALIRAFPDRAWTAMKISSHLHQTEALPHGIAIHEERSRDGGSDSSRYLAAGAARAFWIRVDRGKDDELISGLAPVLATGDLFLIESNRILRCLRPDLCIMVVNCRVQEFKESARAGLTQADAVVAVNWEPSWAGWEGLPAGILPEMPLFPTQDPALLPPGLLDLVRAHLD